MESLIELARLAGGPAAALFFGVAAFLFYENRRIQEKRIDELKTALTTVGDVGDLTEAVETMIDRMPPQSRGPR